MGQTYVPLCTCLASGVYLGTIPCDLRTIEVIDRVILQPSAGDPRMSESGPWLETTSILHRLRAARFAGWLAERTAIMGGRWEQVSRRGCRIRTILVTIPTAGSLHYSI